MGGGPRVARNLPCGAACRSYTDDDPLPRACRLCLVTGGGDWCWCWELYLLFLQEQLKGIIIW